MKYAQVIIDNRASKVDRPFTYTLGFFEDIAKVGMRVVVPFGRGNKPIKGFIIEIREDYEFDYKLKDIIDVLDTESLISKELLSLGLWMRDKYLSSYIDAFSPILPPGDYKDINTFIEINSTRNVEQLLNEEIEIIEFLQKKGICLLDDLKKELKVRDISKYLINLEKLNYINLILDIKTTINKKFEKYIVLNKNIDRKSAVEIIGQRSKKQLEIYNYLLSNGEQPLNQVISSLNSSLSTIKQMNIKEIIEINHKEVSRNPIKKIIPKYKKLNFNNEQLKAFNEIYFSMKENKQENFLLHGITGSGKTEIYLQLVEEMLNESKDTIILVPEISLTPQTIDRFVGRFGDEVAVFHSKLSQGEKFDEWRRIKEGKVKIVVGARSAIFAPFNNLGLIVIDEEHENTYKSSQNPKYDSIEVALKRTKLENAVLVMGTATPSIENYYNSLNGKFRLLEIKERATKMDLPEVTLVDMREELNNGNKSIFSYKLLEELKRNLDNKKQSILFLNRRGFSTFISCRACGYVAKCENCDISMTYHRNINKLRCHYCGITMNPPNVCPVCNSKYIKYFGIGTEKVEEMTKELFPEANIVRMDSDTTSKKGDFEDILEQMKQGKIDILIGTQMISKGLDFPNVTLVGIIAADTTLNLPDYRSPEKAFQLITQVAGRSGRGDMAGSVILQTYNPEHYSIMFAKEQDYYNFFNTEISLRKEFMYPPFINLINILVYGENNSIVHEKIQKIYDIIKEQMIIHHNGDLQNYLIGPNPAPIERIKNNYRWNILVKALDDEIEELKNLINRVCILDEYNLKDDGIKISIDINPNTIL